VSPRRAEEVDMPVTSETPVAAPFEEVQPGDDGLARDRKPGLLTRIREGGLDLRNTWQVVLGALLLPLGVAAILLGWSGAAHGRVDQQQIPYLISGGLLGLATVIVGCFLYWSHWLYRIYDQADLHHQEAMREQADLMRALIEAMASRPGDAIGAGSAPGSDTGLSRAFVATPTGTNFHIPSCPVVANRLPNVRTVSKEETNSMRPCRICEPLGTD
jgi:hypothetical protein